VQIEVPERLPKYRKLKRKPNIVELPTVVTSELVVEPYVEDKIVNSLIKETSIKKSDALKIAREVRRFLLENKIRETSAPMVREICVLFLLKRGLKEIAEQYRRVGLPIADVSYLIREHTRENANLVHNPETIHKLLADAIVREYTLTYILPKHLAKAHLEGLIHIHKMDYFPIRPYCASADARYFLKHGIISDGVGAHVAVTKPAKHAETALMHLAKAYAALQVHHSGAIGMDFFNVFLAPYVQGLPYDRIKQLMQMFIFEMATMPASRGGQVVFSDANFELGVPNVLKDVPAVLPGGVVKEGVTYGDFEDEVRSLFKAAMDVYLEGDASGKPFFFPKPDIKLRKEFIDHEDYAESLLLASRVVAKFGSPYFVNLIPDYMPDVVLAQCCRVLVKMRGEDYEDLVNGRLIGGQFCNNTINLPRIAYEAKEEGKIFELLRQRMELVKEVTMVQRREISTRLKEGSLPLLSMNLDGQPYYRMDKVYHSIGMVGLNEMVQFLTGEELHESEDAWKFGLKVIREMNNIVKEFEEETGLRWVLSQTPAETTATRFAVIDYAKFGKSIKNVVKGNLKKGAIYYTNSTHLNWEANVPLIDKLKIEASFHPLLDGGVVSAVFLGERPDPEAVMSLTKNIAKSTLLAYWSYSLDFTQCRRCSNLMVGILDKCVNCGAEEKYLEWYSRIVNYYSRVRDWHLAKREELKRRFRYRGIL
jgi:ribonucleoside-triphosphate reductase